MTPQQDIEALRYLAKFRGDDEVLGDVPYTLLERAAAEIERLTAERDAALARAAMWDGIQRGTYDAMMAEVERLRGQRASGSCIGI